MRGEALMEVEHHPPKRGAPKADRAVLLAPGAGADMHAANLVAFAVALAAAGVPVLRFNFAYKTAGRCSPPKADTLQDELRDARAELARRTKLP
ncbi:MAG TPA: alpha/beta family hydrolase, partial [Acidimicrobiia bacterium]